MFYILQKQKFIYFLLIYYFFRYHISRNDSNSVLACCTRFGHQEPTLWVQALWSSVRDSKQPSMDLLNEVNWAKCLKNFKCFFFFLFLLIWLNQWRLVNHGCSVTALPLIIIYLPYYYLNHYFINYYACIYFKNIIILLFFKSFSFVLNL